MKPREPKASFFAQGAGIRAIIGGVLIGLLTLYAFYFGLNEYGYSLSSKNIPEEVLTYAKTMAFLVLAASQLLYSLSMRHAQKSIFQIGLFSNRYLIGAILTGLLLQFMAISVPFLAKAFKLQMLSVQDWIIVIAFALVPLILNEVIKFVGSRQQYIT